MPKRAADDGEVTASSKKKAKHESDENASGAESQSNGQLSKDSEGNHYLDLGNMKRATVNVFKGKAQMNIREYYTDKSSGDVKPGKKGITLNSTQWEALTAAIPALSEQLKAVEAGDAGESSKTKTKRKDEKPTKAKKSEKPAPKKKKKKEESEDEESDED